MIGTSSDDSIIIAGMVWLESFFVHAMSTNFVFFLLKDGADLTMESFFLLSTLYRLVRMASLFDDLPFVVEV